jgi:hypothetical protein
LTVPVIPGFAYSEGRTWSGRLDNQLITLDLDGPLLPNNPYVPTVFLARGGNYCGY